MFCPPKRSHWSIGFVILSILLPISCTRSPLNHQVRGATTNTTAPALSLSCALPTRGPSVVEEVRKLAEIRDFPSEVCRHKANSLLSAMTLKEKIGQMTQPHIDSVRDHSLIGSRAIGSVLSGGDNDPPDNKKLSWATMVTGFQRASEESRLKIPLLYGIDAVHGHNNVQGAVIFPHNVGLGATRDADLVRRVGRVTAREVRATNIHWAFAPVVAAAQDERWGRTYEAFGESHELSSELGVALIQGLQGEKLGGPESVLACAKHFLGDGNTQDGLDRGESTIEDAAALAPLIESYRNAVEAQVASVMVSFSSLNGVNMHCNGPLITDTLKHDLAFTGFVVTDWTGVERIDGQDYPEKLASALNAGVDMVMNPKDFDTFHSDFESLVPDRVSTERIDDAVYRILSMKCEAGLFDSAPGQARPGYSTEINHALLDAVGSMPHRQIAREAVRKSLVLLKNEKNALPLQKSGETIHISGRAANDLGLQCGGWTIDWQGGSGAITEGTTILEGLRKEVGNDLLKYSPEDTSSGSTDTAVVVIGEEPYAEWEGDSSDLALSLVDVESVKRARSTAKKVVVVLITGRPLILEPILELTDAVVVAWLPGTEGGGVADVLFGVYPPTGKLPHSWPRTLSQVPINLGDKNYDPLYPYDFGLTFPKVTP